MIRLVVDEAPEVMDDPRAVARGMAMAGASVFDILAATGVGPEEVKRIKWAVEGVHPTRPSVTSIRARRRDEKVEQRQRVIEMMTAGMSGAAAARVNDVNAASAIRWARKAGLPIRRRGQPSNLESSEARAAQLDADYHELGTLEAVGAKHGITSERVRQILKKHGYDPSWRLKKYQCRCGVEFTHATAVRGNGYCSEACAVEAEKVRKIASDTRKSEIAMAYKAGASAAELKERFGVVETHACNIASKLGMTRTAPKGPHKSLSKARILKMIEMRRAGSQWPEIAATCGYKTPQAAAAGLTVLRSKNDPRVAGIEWPSIQRGSRWSGWRGSREAPDMLKMRDRGATFLEIASTFGLKGYRAAWQIIDNYKKYLAKVAL